jgi:hypothetical protein
MKFFFYNGLHVEGWLTGLLVKYCLVEIGKYSFHVPILPLAYSRKKGIMMREAYEFEMSLLEQESKKETLH